MNRPSILALALGLALGLAIVVGLAGPALADDDLSLERGIAQFQAGQFAAAIAPLAAAHAADPSDLDTQLLLGIAYYRLEDLARARPLLVAAARSPDPETRDSARIFLGLIAEADGDLRAAHGYYDVVARGASDLADSARSLRDHDRGERFSAIVALRPEVDSNVPLLASTAMPTGGSTLDTDLFVLGDASVRPFRRFPLVLEQSLSFRKQARLVEFDTLASATSARWAHRDDVYRAQLGYRLDVSTLGGAQYLVGHAGEASARRAIAGSFGLAATYQLAQRSYAPAEYAGYTGVTHTATARLSWLAQAYEVEVGYVFARELTDDAALSATTQGGQVVARINLASGADLRLFGVVADRRYDPAALGRHDVTVRGDASLYLDLWSHVGAVLGGSLLENASSAMDQGYTKWTAYLGLVLATAP
ncbi:MAG TPA: hypothetical protein VFK02_17685 [Kofleriaceae bacterium]|nr:hypothetical protein [Kofleriaceae bacterium]